jgi:hypothetical protein
MASSGITMEILYKYLDCQIQRQIYLKSLTLDSVSRDAIRNVYDVTTIIWLLS